jgi:hypothetical protein
MLCAPVTAAGAAVIHGVWAKSALIAASAGPSLSAVTAHAGQEGGIFGHDRRPRLIVTRTADHQSWHTVCLAGINGSWFLWTVGTQSLAVALASLKPPLASPLAVLAVLMWAVGVVLRHAGVSCRPCPRVPSDGAAISLSARSGLLAFRTGRVTTWLLGSSLKKAAALQPLHVH